MRNLLTLDIVYVFSIIILYVADDKRVSTFLRNFIVLFPKFMIDRDGSVRDLFSLFAGIGEKI